ncbi:MAG TPA: FHA domain-containing protein [Gemmataceae bacterium]|nr:FHA domain-containing protein [Gemmataceae bacterium]
MSFRRFVYYCFLLGAWAGFLGWLLGRFMAPSVPVGSSDYFPHVLHESIIGLFLGFSVALFLSFLDATFSLSLRNIGKVIMRVAAATLIGLFGGLLGSFIGGTVFHFLPWDSVFLIAWIIVGMLVGMSICAFEVSASLITATDFGSSLKKFIKCVVGGTVGGFLGGFVALILRWLAEFLFSGKDVNALLSPTAIGFVAIGACIGLLVGLAQIILKEAWIKVEAGFRPGREMLLAKEKTTIGRGEGSDIALFGDSGVEKAHACIVLDGGRYYLQDLDTPGGSYVNEQRVEGRMALLSGDLIRVGKSILRFNEKTKRKN